MSGTAPCLALTDRERDALAWEDARAELRALSAEVEATMRPPVPAPVLRPAPAPAPLGRLLTDIEAGHYLSLSRSAVRQLVARGALRRVALPACDGTGRRARVLRLDRADLDKFIEQNKEIAS